MSPKTTLDIPTSTTLLNLCQQRSPDAWERFQNLYGPVILYWLRKKRVPVSDQDDVYQEVMTSVYKSLPSFRKDNPNHKFRAWLWSIIAKRAADYFHQIQTVPKPNGDSRFLCEVYNTELDSIEFDGETAPPKQDSTEREILTRQLLEDLKTSSEPLDLEIFRLTEILKLTSRDAAQQLGITPDALRQRKSRFLKRIHKEYDDFF